MVFTTVRDKNRGVLLGYLGNLTFHGLLVIGEKPLEVGSQTSLDIEFPDELPGTPTRRMVVSARVARCVQDQESLRDYNIGFEFIDIEPEHTQAIQSLLERYHFRYQD
jgi:c-di-GMP-binding flagellar brake protein YcgR